MGGLKRRQNKLVVLLALLSVHLVYCELAAANSITDSLPALVLDDEQPAFAKEPKVLPAATSEPQATTTVQSEEAASSTSKAVFEEPKATEEPKLGSAAKADESSSSAPTTSTTESTATSESHQDKEATTTSQPADPEPNAAPASKDISVLLANKDDAENDLSSASVKPSVVNSPSEDAPVETNKPTNDANDNRFHYAFGEKFGDDTKSADPEIKIASAQPAAATTTTQAPPQTTEKSEEASTELPKEKAESASAPAAVPAPAEAPKEESSDSSSKPSVVDPSTKEAPTTQASPGEIPKKAVDPQPVATTTQEIPPSPTTTEAPKRESPEAPAKPAEPTTTTTTAKPTDKPAGLPAILASAVGTAIGNAVVPLLVNKDQKPQVAAASPTAPVPVSPSSTTAKPAAAVTTTSTTKAPSTTRKSTTNKWDFWTSTSSTASPRRRPILPSIRRRFRPYNRFSPFPWANGGVDSYTPFGTDAAFGPADPMAPWPARPTTSETTMKPKRRGSSTTEPSRSDSSETEENTTTPGRRRGEGANRRKHNHHHHHNRNFNRDNEPEPSVNRRRRPHTANRRDHHDRDESPQSDPFSPRYPRPHGPGFNMFGPSPIGSGFDLLNPFSGWSDEADKPRPSAGSGLNSRPSTHRPGSHDSPTIAADNRPVPVGGDFSDERPLASPHDRDRDYGHGHGHGHNGRDDYDHYGHDHHHDCHDDDYDHGHDYHHRDPHRPPRDPYRPIVEVNYGGRPGRPYRPRGGSVERTGDDKNEATPSLYHSKADAPSLAVSPTEPRRIPSIFSPFDSLFSSIDEDIFNLRSSFMDPASHAFDAIISSPKIKLPGPSPSGPSAQAQPQASQWSSDRLKSSKDSVTSNGKKDSDAAVNDKIVASDASTSSNMSSVSPRSASWSPCSFPERSLLCLFMNQQRPMLELLHRI